MVILKYFTFFFLHLYSIVMGTLIIIIVLYVKTNLENMMNKQYMEFKRLVNYVRIV
jgi:hypothetical protein